MLKEEYYREITMRLIFKGPYTVDDRLPHEELRKHNNAVKFKEFTDTARFLVKINLASFFILAATMLTFHLRAGITKISLSGVLMIFISMIPHEFIHATFFKRRAYLYLHKCALIITGTEPMPKWRYIAMVITPSLLFGFLPFILFVINPDLTIFGTFGAIALPMCLGDWYNAYNCYTQVPSNGQCFMSKQNTYWFVPHKQVKSKNLRSTSLDYLFAGVSIASIVFFLFAGARNQECVGDILQIILYQLTAYSIVGLMQMHEPQT